MKDASLDIFVELIDEEVQDGAILEAIVEDCDSV